MLVLGILMIGFHFSGRQAQSITYRFTTSEMARQLAAAAQEEAFCFLYDKTGRVYADSSLVAMNPIPGKIIHRDTSIDISSSGLSNRSSIPGIELEIPTTKALANQMIGDRMEIKATARLVDFRNHDYKEQKFYDNEGIGTIEIAVSVKAKENYKKMFPGACTMIRHHDYKVVSILSKKDNRENDYVGNRCLDYVLFIKNGAKEFLDSNGLSLNPENNSASLEIDAGDSLGKINLGNGGGDYLYLNLSKDRDSFITTAKTATRIPELDARDSDVDDFFPQFRNLVKNAIEGADFKDVWGHKAYFEYVRLPVTNDVIDTFYTDSDNPANLKNSRFIATLNSIAQGKILKIDQSQNKTDFFNGIKIKPEDKLDQIIETDIRKQFFNLGYMKLDLTDCVVKVEVSTLTGSKPKEGKLINEAPEMIEKFKKLIIPCFNKDYYVQELGSNFQMEKLYNFVRNHSGGNYTEIASKTYTYINDEYSYEKDDSPHKTNATSFYRLKNGDVPQQPTDKPYLAYRPYAHYNLWNKRFIKPIELEEFGIYDREANKLYLRGITHISETIEIGDEGSDLEVEGCGVLIAPNIKINGGIKKKNPKEICVFFARNGNITVNTDKEINAVLIALGKDHTSYCSLKAEKNLNLKGALIVDQLLLKNWNNNGTHKITYDEALAPVKDIYQINISKATTFERVIENE